MPDRAPRLLRSICLRLVTIAAVVLVAGLACATMVRFAPGFGVDERELDPRLSAESIAALRSQNAGDGNIGHFYWHFLAGLLHGDLGQARTFSQPIAQLMKDRAPATAQNIGYGLALAWSITLAAAFAAAALQNKAAEVLLSAASIALLSLPAAVVALVAVIARKPASIAIALALVPVLYRYSRNVIAKNCAEPWIAAARARGVSKGRILFCHVLPGASPQLVALAGVSLNMAFGAALPIEVVADSPGLGQLAWQAALARDLPLLVTVTGVVATMTLVANACAATVNDALRMEHA